MVKLLVILDMQEGLFSLARDYDPVVYKNAMYAHAELGRVFDLPVVMSTSAETGEQRRRSKKPLNIYLLYSKEVCGDQDLTGPCLTSFSTGTPKRLSSSGTAKSMRGITLSSGKPLSHPTRPRSSWAESSPMFVSISYTILRNSLFPLLLVLCEGHAYA